MPVFGIFEHVISIKKNYVCMKRPSYHKLWVIMSLTAILLPLRLFPQAFVVLSPDHSIELQVIQDIGLWFSVAKQGQIVIGKTRIGLETDGDRNAFRESITHQSDRWIHDTVVPHVPYKNALIHHHCRELLLQDAAGFGIRFRVYNDGVAYQWEDYLDMAKVVKHETLQLSLPTHSKAWFPEENSMYSHNERSYLHESVTGLSDSSFCSLPMLFEPNDNLKVLFTETALHHYPNLFLQKLSNGNFEAIFPPVVLEALPNQKHGPDRNQLITKTADYIAETAVMRNFPWRVFIVGDDKAIIESNLAFALANPAAEADWSWVKPGKVAWDWYNANNIFGVDFASGLNTATYKYYIDFAAENGIEYVILDEGWTKSTTEIMAFNPDMDVQELIRYGESKGVGIILWVLWKPLNDNMEEILTTYKSWGAKGIKVDFMQRSDQEMVRSYEAIAALAARLHLLVDFHGAFKPQGLQRSYPNVLNFEGVMGAENNKWSKHITPDHNLTIPFIRMAAGPMDYTPGAMVNGGKDDFAIRWNRPMSQGTRAHQVAMYVVYEAPLQMLCESPSVYRREQETVDFITGIPTTWDETRVLEAAIGDYLVLARRKGDDWYIGGMTDWEARTFVIPTHFLRGSYDVVSYADGMNAEKFAEDYRILKHTVTSGDTLRIEMKPGGGFAAILRKKHDF